MEKKLFIHDVDFLYGEKRTQWSESIVVVVQIVYEMTFRFCHKKRLIHFHITFITIGFHARCEWEYFESCFDSMGALIDCQVH